MSTCISDCLVICCKSYNCANTELLACANRIPHSKHSDRKGVLKDLKPKFKVSKFLGYLASSIATFLAPILLSLFFTWISSVKQGLSFHEVYKTHIFGPIMQSVLCLLIMVLIAHLFFESKTNEMISKGWQRFLSGAAIVCFIIALVILVIAVLYAAGFCVPFMLEWYKLVAAVELFGASAGIIVQCLTHTEIYVVV